MRRLTMPRLGGLSEGAPAASSPSANPNLLLWSEALDNAAWTTSGAVVTANAALDPDGQMTAESVAFSAFGTITQRTTTAATTGAEVTDTIPATGTLSRLINLSGTFDGATYVFSGYVKNAGSDIIFTMRRAGGFIEVELQDGGDGATFVLSWMKLETPDLTAYVKREGT